MLVLVVLCASPGDLVAQEPDTVRGPGTTADEADVQFQLGNQAYKRRDYRAALSHYFASNRLAPNRNVLFNIARCYEQIKRYVEAYRYYLFFEAGGELAEARKQSLAAAMERVRPYVSLLRIATQPEGAIIFLNRKELGAYGKTPALLAVAPGKYRVILELPGYQPAVREDVAVGQGKAVNLELRMERIVGHLRVKGQPVGAQVRVDRKSVV